MAILNVPITKGKTTLAIDTDKDIPDDMYAEVLLQGLKVVLNRGASKITKETYPVADELKAAAMAKAAEQVELLRTSKVKVTGGKAKSGVSGAVMTEARRLARNLVKDAMKAAGVKISHVEASEITKAANALLAEDPSIVEKAKTNLDERAKVPVAETIIAGIKISDKKVKAAEAKKAKDQLSKTQAGKVQTRKKGQGKSAEAQA